MRILFGHQGFPGQYLHIAPAIARVPGNEVVALTMGGGALPGVRMVRHRAARGSTAGIHPLAGDFESKVIRGESAAVAAMDLRAPGFEPDVICGHPGWGETLFLKDVWPKAVILSFVEFYYRSSGADVDFDPEFPLDEMGKLRIRSKNASLCLALADSDWSVCPTEWQARQIPDVFRDRLSVVHDGVDTDKIRPSPAARIRLGRDGVELKPGDEVVTFVNRNFEPYRGYHLFIRALPDILRRRPRARVVLVGGDGVSYGSVAEGGTSYRQKYLDEVKDGLDMSRVHFVGAIPHAVFLQLLQVSAAHVYLTYPFVLSWSMLEAMAAECLIVGSATSPVQEVIRDGENGVLVDFFSPEAISSAVIDALARPDLHRPMRRAARQTIVGDYDLTRVCLPRHMELIRSVTGASGSEG